MALGAPQQSAHRVLHRRCDVRSTSSPATSTTSSSTTSSPTAATLVMVMMMMVIRRLVVHHLFDPRGGRRCHLVAVRLRHVHRDVHVRSYPDGFAVRLLDTTTLFLLLLLSRRPEHSSLPSGSGAYRRVEASPLDMYPGAWEF